MTKRHQDMNLMKWSFIELISGLWHSLINHHLLTYEPYLTAFLALHYKGYTVILLNVSFELKEIMTPCIKTLYHTIDALYKSDDIIHKYYFYVASKSPVFNSWYDNNTSSSNQNTLTVMWNHTYTLSHILYIFCSSLTYCMCNDYH